MIRASLGLRVPESLTGMQPQRPSLAALVAAFGHRLHQEGLPVTPERSIRFVAAITIAEPTQLSQLYWLGRVTYLTANDHVPTYDRVFREVFTGTIDMPELAEVADQATASPTPSGDRTTAETGSSVPAQGSSRSTTATPGEASSDDEQDDPSALAAASRDERLHDREFSTLNDDELALIRRLVERLPVVPPTRLARRTKRDRSGERWDVRATLRGSHRTAGDPVNLTRRRRTSKPRRIILIADVSGSMEPYARIYLHLMRGAVVALRAEAFAFATRLTRLTRALRIERPDAAYRKVSEDARDWSGGTRIGASLKDFIDQHGRRGLARGAVVVIVSDGWEIGDTALLRESMARLARLAHRVIWVNPRQAARGYQPLVGGMAAALPYVDTFVSGHSLSAIEDVLEAIASATPRPSIGR